MGGEISNKFNYLLLATILFYTLIGNYIIWPRTFRFMSEECEIEIVEMNIGKVRELLNVINIYCNNIYFTYKISAPRKINHITVELSNETRATNIYNSLHINNHQCFMKANNI